MFREKIALDVLPMYLGINSSDLQYQLSLDGFVAPPYDIILVVLPGVRATQVRILGQHSPRRLIKLPLHIKDCTILSDYHSCTLERRIETT